MRFASIRRQLTQRRNGPSATAAVVGEIGYEEFRAIPATELSAKLASGPHAASRWVEAAARHGFPEAQLTLGQMLLDGIGLARNHPAAFRWFRRAAAFGLPEAMNMTGRCLELGWGATADPRAAAHWYRRAAERGLDWAQYNLGNLLLRGNGVPQNRLEAFAWYRRAALQGHAKAMNLLGRFLEEGWDIPADPGQAQVWYRRSAEGGDFRGQFNLATSLISQGRHAEGERWLRVAIDGGSPDFLLAAGESLTGRTEPDLQRLGHMALARHAAASEANPATARC